MEVANQPQALLTLPSHVRRGSRRRTRRGRHNQVAKCSQFAKCSTVACQLEICCCVRVLSLCRRTCSRCHSWAFCKSECLAVATVPSPAAVVCFRKYVFYQCSRSADVATCSRVGPSARRCHSLTFSSVTPCLRVKRLSLLIVFQISLENVCILYLLHCTFCNAHLGSSLQPFVFGLRFFSTTPQCFQIFDPEPLIINLKRFFQPWCSFQLKRFFFNFGNFFSSGPCSFFLKKCACCKYIATIDVVIENLFRNLFSCSRRMSPHSQYMRPRIAYL